MDMIERVARALSVADGMHPQAASNDDDEQPTWTLYVGMAKAAIEALREPTEAMVEVGTEARWKSAVRDANSVREIWAQMIDAALKEHEGAKDER